MQWKQIINNCGVSSLIFILDWASQSMFCFELVEKVGWRQSVEVFRRSQPTIYGAAYRTPPLRQGSPETHFLQVCHALIARYPTIFRRHLSEYFFPKTWFNTSRQPLLYALIVSYHMDSEKGNCKYLFPSSKFILTWHNCLLL